MSALHVRALVHRRSRVHGVRMSSSMELGGEADVAWTDIVAVNHEKVWRVLERMGPGELTVLFARALRFVPPEVLGAVFRDHVQPCEVGDGEAGLGSAITASGDAPSRA